LKSIAAQHALAPDAAPLRFAAQVKRGPLGGFTELDVFREKYLVVCQHSFDTTPVHRV
jgi:hypothetical protein